MKLHLICASVLFTTLSYAGTLADIPVSPGALSVSDGADGSVSLATGGTAITLKNQEARATASWIREKGMANGLLLRSGGLTLRRDGWSFIVTLAPTNGPETVVRMKNSALSDLADALAEGAGMGESASRVSLR